MRVEVGDAVIDRAKVVSATDEGTPQGGIISPVLANLVLDKLAGRIEKSFSVEINDKATGSTNQLCALRR